MIRHIVWWKLKDQAQGHSAAENAERILRASAALSGLPGVKSVEVSVDIQPSTTVPVQVVLCSTHENMKALDEYKNSPAHLEFAALISELAESRQAIDYKIN